MLRLDADYVLVIFGGISGYQSDDINKFLWMVGRRVWLPVAALLPTIQAQARAAGRPAGRQAALAPHLPTPRALRASCSLHCFAACCGAVPLQVRISAGVFPEAIVEKDYLANVSAAVAAACWPDVLAHLQTRLGRL